MSEVPVISLHNTVLERDLDTIDALLTSNAVRVDERNADGDLPLDLAVKYMSSSCSSSLELTSTKRM